MPALLFQIVTAAADLVILIFAVYYFFRLGSREKELEKKETKIDTDYHHIVDTALAKERKILEDATAEADRIIANSKQISENVKDEVNQALQLMVVDIQKQAYETAKNFTDNYQDSLAQLAKQSMTDFQTIVKGLDTDLQKQIKEFHDLLLPQLETELADYKQARLRETEKIVVRIVQKASQEILNKSLSLEDHKSLVIESLENAKKQGAFD